MIWATDRQGELIYICAAWYAFSGLTPKQTLGTAWIDAVHPDDQEFVRAGFREASDLRIEFTHEYRVRDHSGRYVWVHEAAAPSFVPGTRDFVGFLGLVTACEDQARSAAIRAVVGQYAPRRPDATFAARTALDLVAEHLIAAKSAALGGEAFVMSAVDEALFQVGRAIAREVFGAADVKVH